MPRPSRGPGWIEFERLTSAGVNPGTAAVLGLGVMAGDLRLPPPIDHGTDRGYYQHRKRHQPTCQPCRGAHADAAHERTHRPRRTA